MGTANYGQQQSFTRLEADSEADKFPPLYIGYYQDKHYQSLEWTGGSEVREMVAAITEQLLSQVVALAEERSSRPRKRCKILPVVPFKGFKKTAADIARENKENEKLDSLIDFLNRKKKCDEKRLDIFQNFDKIERIMQAFRVAAGGQSVSPSVGGSGHSQGQERKTGRKSKPLQLAMGPVVIPTKYKDHVSDEEQEVEEIEIIKTETKVPGPVSNDKPGKEAVTHILDVYKCNKCNHAFEKINLFVKHFIKVHKDVIDVNKSSSNFSFSNFWTKMKVKASSKKKNEAVDVVDDGLSLESFLNVKKVKVVNDNNNGFDLLMNCSSHPFLVEKKAVRSKQEDDILSSTREETKIDPETLCYLGLAPTEFSTLVCDVEDQETAGEPQEPEPVLVDKYQMIPLSEIKVENPLEELNFPLASRLPISPMKEAVKLRDEEIVVGLASDSELLADDLLEDILENVFAVIAEIHQEEEVQEIFDEMFHDESRTRISHQIFIKDFTWTPLEDQFADCPEQEEISQILAMRGLTSEADKLRAVRGLLVKTNNNSAAIKSYITRILGDRFLAGEADHSQSVPAVARTVRLEHDYTFSSKSRKKALVKPKASVMETLKKMRSKVSIAPTHVYDLKKKSSFIGKKLKPRRVLKDLVVRLGKDSVDVEKNLVRPILGRRAVQVINLGQSGPASLQQSLDQYLTKSKAREESSEKPQETRETNTKTKVPSQGFNNPVCSKEFPLSASSNDKDLVGVEGSEKKSKRKRKSEEQEMSMVAKKLKPWESKRKSESENIPSPRKQKFRKTTKSSVGKNSEDLISREPEGTTAQSTFDSQLKAHLESLREPLHLENISSKSAQAEREEGEVEPTVRIKSEPVDSSLTETSYNIKLEAAMSFETSVPSVSSLTDYNIKTEQDPDLYSFLSSVSVKSEPVKEEPVEVLEPTEDTSDEIEILGTSINSEAGSDSCDVVVSVVRCHQCFQSFTSREALALHAATHRPDQENFNPSQWLTQTKSSLIAGSKFPVLNMERVSLENHDYIFQQTARKERQVGPKMTTLQALDSLLGSSKKTEKTRPEQTFPVEAKSETDSSFTCQVCWKVNFGSMEAMRKHLAHHPHAQCVDKVNICCLCDTKYDKRDHQYKVHVDKHLIEMVNSPKNQCLGCHAFFKSKDLLMSHVQKIHQKDNIYPCSYCGKQYGRRDQLSRHLVIIHNKTIN